LKLFLKYLFLFVIISIIPALLYSQKSLEDVNSNDDLKQFIFANAPDEDAFVAVQRLAAQYIDKKDWIGAVKIFNKYTEWFPEMHFRFEKIIDLLNAPSQNLITKNISAVNTKGDEYFPVLSIDGNKMYFTGARREDCIGGEDIFYSNYLNGQWQAAKNMGPPFSTKEDDAINSVSADGNTLVIFGNYKGALGGGDNFYVEKTKSGWSTIKPFPYPVNTKYWECDGFLTADGKAILFTSDRPGGIGEFHKGGEFFHGIYEGNTDIYVCLKNDSGWSKPINLGPVINTPYTERSPFLHPDGRTLYFSSDGFYGLGELDVFKSVRLSDTSWTEWSEPVNLGKDINTSKFDIAYKITTDGSLAYFSSNRPGGKGGYDIYSITLPPEAKPNRNVITVKGKVYDESNNPLEADLKWFELDSNKNVGILKSNPQNGEYLIVLPVGKIYSYFADKQGYYSVSNDIDISSESNYKEIEVDIRMISISYMKEQGTSIKLNNIYFDFDKYDIKPNSYIELNRIYKFLLENPGIKIEISAYTDSKGSDEYNLNLSQKRAESVVNNLISKGIDGSRMVARGYGKSHPVAANDTEEGRALNRRVEMRIIQ
jgi:outer membrane protein OmpA-like peptidoglycan-associated protein